MASIALRLVFPPRPVKEGYYYWWESTRPLPTGVARAMGACTVVAVDVEVHRLHLLRDTPPGGARAAALRTLVRSPQVEP